MEDCSRVEKANMAGTVTMGQRSEYQLKNMKMTNSQQSCQKIRQ
jgi:hypothetical protein